MPAISILSRSLSVLATAADNLRTRVPPSRRRGNANTGVDECVSTR
jgi:hypothetical protein